MKTDPENYKPILKHLESLPQGQVPTAAEV